jgi:hypothetical protein
LPVTGIPALPAAFATWGPLEWLLVVVAALVVLGALAVLISVVVRKWILPANGRRRS